jgi:lipoprotein-releasing system permease protein
MKLSDIYRADQVADTLSGQVPYEVRSWMRDNQSLLAGLRAQSIFSTMIRLSTVIAAGFSIASILFMSVTSKRREIGILKAIGATRRQIAGIFAIEGTLIGIVGATLGAVVGIAIAQWMTTITIVSQYSGRLEGMFPIRLTVELVAVPALVAVVIGLLAALYPARQASIVNPIDVIRSQ